MTALRQILIIGVGFALATAMALLGLWQLDVYKSQGDKTAAARMAAAPLDLRVAAPAGVPVTEGFGRSVSFSGQYQADDQLLVPLGDTPGYRVLTGLRQDDGSVVAVVRGVTTSSSAPAAPTGPVTEVGVLLPSEDNAPITAVTSDQLDAVRLPLLAQRWDGQLIGGYVTLAAANAEAQGLQPAPLNLPEAKGRLRNAAYALQWWVFGAFAIAMSIRIARDIALRDDLDAVEVTAGADS